MYIYTSCASVCLYLNKRLNTQFVVTDSPYLLTEHHGVPRCLHSARLRQLNGPFFIYYNRGPYAGLQ